MEPDRGDTAQARAARHSLAVGPVLSRQGFLLQARYLGPRADSFGPVAAHRSNISAPEKQICFMLLHRARDALAHRREQNKVPQAGLTARMGDVEDARG